MKCTYCKYNDGLIYTSIPPKYKCTITNEFHLGLDDCDVEFMPVRHGRWVHDGCDFPHGNDWIHCSVCGKRGINVPADLTPYCPNCGAKMDK